MKARGEPTYDCMRCGACCLSGVGVGGVEYVFLDKDESKRMKRRGLTVVRVDGMEYLGTRQHAGADNQAACVAFVGKVGTDCGCAVYADRPRNCRSFEVGSVGCREAREEAGLPI